MDVRIDSRLCGNDKKLAICPFAIIGDPSPREFLSRIRIYLNSQPDFLELGLPFSDPIADGPVIQAAHERALAAGMTVRKALALVKKIRSMTNIPIGIMTYANLPIAYGTAHFYEECKKAGVSSVLPADVPFEESGELQKNAQEATVAHIFMIAENTPLPRIKEICLHAEGFIYVVSTLGVTGTRRTMNEGIGRLLKKIMRYTNLPLAVGFGISKASHLRALKKSGAGAAIIGSALVKTPTKKLSAVLLTFNECR